MKNKTLLLVDGSNLLFQMFYGMPSRIVNSKGEAIHGVLGFVGALLKIIKYIGSDYVAVIFDSECANERRELDENYKANRPDFSSLPEDETPFSQLPLIYKVLDFMKITHWEVKNGETDDTIASYVFRYKDEMKIFISSFDSDFFQLIEDNVFVFRYRGEKSYICNVDYIKEKFGIKPSQYADFKSLTGDKADNIKGAQNVGNKTASHLINSLGALENIIENSERIKKPSVKNSVISCAQRLMLNKKLITLSDKSDIPFHVDELGIDLDFIKSAQTRYVLEKNNIL